MKIGVINRPGKDLLSEIAYIGEHGFEFVDLTLGPPTISLDQLDSDEIYAALAQHKLGVVASIPALLPLVSPFTKVHKAALEEARACLRIAQQLGAATVSVHFTYSDGDFSVDNIVEWHVKSLASLCNEASDLGVKILLKNASHGGHHQFNLILAILDKVPKLGFHLSSGHARLEGSYDRFDEYLNRFGSRLMHVQLSDNDGTADQHLPLGSTVRGGVNWPQHIQQLKRCGYDGTITLKVFSPEHEYILLSRTLLKRWWDT